MSTNGQPETNGQSPGGQGGPLQNLEEGSGQTSDTRLLARALRERWPIPDEYKKTALDRQAKVATDPKSSNREAAIAFRSLLTAEAQNMEVEKRELQVAGLLSGDGVPIEVNIYNDYREACNALKDNPEQLEAFYDGLAEAPTEPGSNGHGG